MKINKIRNVWGGFYILLTEQSVNINEMVPYFTIENLSFRYAYPTFTF